MKEEQSAVKGNLDIKIVDYLPIYKDAFKNLNEFWIRTYFEMEEADYNTLNRPEEIIDAGGKIFVALKEGVPVGVCALKKSHDPKYDYEMSKMAVDPLAQGLGIGYLLGKAIIQGAKSLGASCIYLEGNTLLKASIRLYRKLGFEEVPVGPSPFKRVNIKMALYVE